FFQAEDGIRDRNVTGVQTCALSDLCRRFRSTASSATDLIEMPAQAVRQRVEDDPTARRRSQVLVHHKPGRELEVEHRRQHTDERSEERRVGKEGRAREGAWRGERKR